MFSQIVVQEFERKLEECLAVREDLLGQEDGEASNDSTEPQSNLRSKSKAKGKAVPKHAPSRIKRGGRAGGRGRRNVSSSEESEDSDFENRNPVRKSTGRGQPEPTGVTKVIDDSDSSGKDLNSISNFNTLFTAQPYVYCLLTIGIKNSTLRPRRTRKLSESN